MPFTPVRGKAPAFVADFYMTPNEAGVIGEAVIVVNGFLTRAVDDDMPDYILAQNIAAAAVPTVKPLCWPVDEITEWETVMGVVNPVPAPVIPGSAITIAVDGLAAHYSTTNGVFTVTGVENTGNAVVGDRVRGKFRQ